MKREKAAIIKLRQFGWSINSLSKFTGRSFSVIHKILKIAGYTPGVFYNSNWHQDRDLRKLPNQLRLKAAQKHRLSMHRFMELWEGFILGTEDKPP